MSLTSRCTATFQANWLNCNGYLYPVTLVVKSLDEGGSVGLSARHLIYGYGVVAQDQPHPIRKMVDTELYCTIHSDDPAMFSTSLTNEYLRLAQQGFS